MRVIPSLLPLVLLLGAIVIGGCETGRGKVPDGSAEAGASDVSASAAGGVSAVGANADSAGTDDASAGAARADGVNSSGAGASGARAAGDADDAATDGAAPPGIVTLAPGVRVDRARGAVELDGIIVLDAGMLEQVACARGTREHESIFSPDARPSIIHAAMLVAGFEPGHPGSWRLLPDGGVERVPPAGDPVEVLLRTEGEAFRPISTFIRDARTGRSFPDRHFVFAGSLFAPNPPAAGPGEHYVADRTGSIVGIVTFGDEVIAWDEVIPDAAAVAEPVWEANPLRLPPPGAPATLLLRRPAPSSR